MANYVRDIRTNNILTCKSKKIVHYSYDDFIESVIQGNCCFICGAMPHSKPFNNEHVIPRWILKHYGTPESFIVLPNGTTMKHAEYKVPCCQQCNSELGEKFENPMSKFLRRDYEEVSMDLENNPRLYLWLFRWMCLLFFKTHYKDSFLRMEQDTRRESGTIADTYCWHGLYHVHSIARQHYTRAQISDNVYGSIIVFEALTEFETDDFDYLDNLDSQTIMIKVGKIVVFAVLNDSRYCLAIYREFLSKISGSLNTIQIRELFARLRYANQNIKVRPRFYQAIDGKKGHRIKALRARNIELFQGEEQVVSLFKLMRFYMESIMHQEVPHRDELLHDIEHGKAQYIFDEEYNFFQYKGYGESK